MNLTPTSSAILTAYTYLAIAIICEVLGTTFLVQSKQFSQLVPTVFMGVLYAVSFYCLAQTVKTIPIGIAYAIWGGLGIVLTTLVGLVIFKQRLDMAAIIGIIFIAIGVIVLNVFSNSVGH